MKFPTYLLFFLFFFLTIGCSSSVKKAPPGLLGADDLAQRSQNTKTTPPTTATRGKKKLTETQVLMPSDLPDADELAADDSETAGKTRPPKKTAAADNQAAAPASASAQNAAQNTAEKAAVTDAAPTGEGTTNRPRPPADASPQTYAEWAKSATLVDRKIFDPNSPNGAVSPDAVENTKYAEMKALPSPDSVDPEAPPEADGGSRSRTRGPRIKAPRAPSGTASGETGMGEEGEGGTAPANPDSRNEENGGSGDPATAHFAEYAKMIDPDAGPIKHYRLTPPDVDNVIEIRSHRVKVTLSATIVHFETNSVRLTPASRKLLMEMGAFLGQNPQLWNALELSGHSDARGNPSRNLLLSYGRASSAKNALVDGGAPAEKLSAIGYGQFRPLDPANNPAAWAKNRRVEFRFSGVKDMKGFAEKLLMIQQQYPKIESAKNPAER